MLRSMTGFGAAAGEVPPGASIRVEVRSVNHRHLALKLRLPEAFVALEPEVEARVRARCERGSVTLHASVERASGAAAARIDHAAARAYKAELEGLARELGLATTLSLDTLATLPGVIVAAAAPELEESLGAAFLAHVEQALDALVVMRAREGVALAADLRKNAAALRDFVARIETRMPAVLAAHKAALERRIQELVGRSVTLEPADLAREVALLCDKLDVSEELARLASHLAQFDELLAKGGRAGRQLDFLVQELLREVNTIGSKCSDAEAAHLVVEAKTHVERLREQVQNIE
jgi:uncharacterized protein (TIGR00255 family)